MFIIRRRKYIINASIKDNGGRNFLYGKDEDIENWFDRLEGEWAAIVKKIINEEKISNMNIEEYASLLLFIYMSDVRTAQVADYQADVINHLMKSTTKLKNMNLKEIENLKINVTIPNLLLFWGAPKTVEIMSDLEPVLLKNNTSRQFITSDCPVVKYNQLFIERDYIRNYGYGLVGFQCFIPLNDKLCFALIDKAAYNYKSEHGGIIHINGADQIAELNKLILYNSDEFIFFNNTEREWVIKRLAENKKEHKKQEVRKIETNKGDFIAFESKSIFKKVKLPFFQPNKEYLAMPFPMHSTGPLRPLAQSISDKED